jgi:hypothetical protein
MLKKSIPILVVTILALLNAVYAANESYVLTSDCKRGVKTFIDTSQITSVGQSIIYTEKVLVASGAGFYVPGTASELNGEIFQTIQVNCYTGSSQILSQTAQTALGTKQFFPFYSGLPAERLMLCKKQPPNVGKTFNVSAIDPGNLTDYTAPWGRINLSYYDQCTGYITDGLKPQINVQPAPNTTGYPAYRSY